MIEISAQLARFEGKTAILKNKDEQEIIWPIKLLPDDLKEGETVKLILKTTSETATEQRNLAKEMLNEILNDQNNSSHS